MALGFIRFFAVTDDSPIGRAALGYLTSLLRIAPVRVVSKSGHLEGAWRRFEALLLTPMTGPCVSCVCTHPSSWVWEQSVIMPASDLGAQGAAQAPDAPKAGGTATGTVELYTPPWPGRLLRNVLFIASPPPYTAAQLATAAKYEAVVVSDPAWPVESRDVKSKNWIVRVPVTDHVSIRHAVLGPPGPS